MKYIVALVAFACVSTAFATSLKEQVKEAAVISSPADNIIALLTQVKENLEHIDASSSARATERQRHCVKREKIMANRLSSMKLKAGIRSDDEEKGDAEKNAKAASAASKLDRAVKKRKGDRLLNQYRNTQTLVQRLQDGFNADLESYALASNVRDASHTAFVEHQSRYNSYTHTLEAMVSTMEQHFANSKGSAATESKKTGGMSLLEVSNDDLEWESPDAHRVHTYLSELLSQFDREQATEHSIEEAMYVAHDEAISNRDASKERLDHLMKKINATKRSIGKELRELGFSTDGKKLGLDGSTKKANATKKLKLPGSVTKEDIENAEMEMKAWKQECEERKKQGESARLDRLAQIKMVARLEETIMERLMIVKNTLLKKEEKEEKNNEEGTDGPLGKSSTKPLKFDTLLNADEKEGADRQQAKNAVAQTFLKHAKATSDTTKLLENH